MFVYNLEVEDFHSYFVGCVPILVHNYMTTPELTKIANKLGYTKVNGAKSNGQAVYTNGKTYITYDVDAHNGGFWKMAKTIDGLRSKSTRMGTYDRNLNRIGD